MRILPVPCLSDNYAYLVVCDATKTAAIVDPSTLTDTERALDALRKEGIEVREVWATHHHGDHVGGVDDVCNKLGIDTVVGFEPDRARLPRLTLGLADGERHTLGTISVRAIHVPGHTSGALAYYCEEPGSTPCVFSGDTLFAAGCGRLFEGTPAQMHKSLSRLSALPGDTRVFPGHEYTVANLAFAAHVEPDNEAVANALVRARALRAKGEPTIPTSMADERAYNPFLRAGERALRRGLGLPMDATDVDTFAAARKKKDTFVAQ